MKKLLPLLMVAATLATLFGLATLASANTPSVPDGFCTPTPTVQPPRPNATATPFDPTSTPVGGWISPTPASVIYLPAVKNDGCVTSTPPTPILPTATPVAETSTPVVETSTPVPPPIVSITPSTGTPSGAASP